MRVSWIDCVGIDVQLIKSRGDVSDYSEKDDGEYHPGYSRYDYKRHSEGSIECVNDTV